MKKIALSLLITFIAFGSLFSQVPSNIIIFSEDAYPFYVIMNGIKHNQKAQTNVAILNLTSPVYKTKIIFEDKTIPSISKNIYTKEGLEVTYRIRKNRKGENVLRYYTENEASFDPIHEERVREDNVELVTNEGYNENSTGVSVNININENGVNYNMDTPDGSVNANINVNVNETGAEYEESISVAETNYYIDDAPETQVYHMPGYSGTIGCDWPMDANRFSRAKQTIEKVDFASDKLRIAKQVIKSNCLTAEQVKELTSLFDFESDKVKFAKFAYLYTFDIENYFMINDVFEFSSSIKQLDDYIKSVR